MVAIPRGLHHDISDDGIHLTQNKKQMFFNSLFGIDKSFAFLREDFPILQRSSSNIVHLCSLSNSQKLLKTLKTSKTLKLSKTLKNSQKLSKTLNNSRKLKNSRKLSKTLKNSRKLF